MAAAASEILTNRVSLPVSHNNDGHSEYNVYRTSTSTSSHANSGNGVENNGGAFDMRNMGDESDRIKLRMKDFEERCKRWREDFFSRSNQTGSLHHADHRSTTDLNNNFATSSSPPFASSLHRSSVEDTDNGGKKYKIEFDIGDFKQNELQISTNNRTLTVKGDREVKAGSATETKTFNRELTVPDYVDMEKMNAFLMDNSASVGGNSPSSPTKQLIAHSTNGSGGPSNILILEAPIIMEKYSYRRSAFDNKANQSPINIKPAMAHHHHSHQIPASSSVNGGINLARNTVKFNPTSHTESHHTENKTSTTSTTHTTSRVVHGGGVPSDGQFYTSRLSNKAMPIDNGAEDFFYSSPTKTPYPGHHHSNQSLAPELIAGYPMYDSAEGCVIYKFDFAGFDQSEIHLTITIDRTLEIKACKETSDHLGKVYREFKREIQLEPEVDANLIKNLLFEGILTLKIPKPNRPDGPGSLSNNHNLNSPNGFQEFYTDDGKLAKLTSDFRGYNPENVKIILSANNVLKVNAQQSDTSPTHQGQTVQKECSRQYTLPASIQPEQMKAIMSRDGILTVDFTKP